MQRIPVRNEIPEQFKWNMMDIFPSKASWRVSYKACSEKSSTFAKWNGKVHEAPAEALKEYFSLQESLMPVIEYAFLSREADNASVDAQELYDQAMGLIVQTRGDSSFFEPELLSLPKETLTSLQQQEDLTDYNVYLANLIRQKDHTLSKDQELLLSSMSEILSGSNHIYSTFTNVDLHFPDMHMPDGSTVPLTEGTYGEFRVSANPDIRKQAFEHIFSTYAQYGTTFATIYATNVKKDVALAKARHYHSALHAAMSPLEIPETVYTQLIEVIHHSLPLLQRYLRLRKKAMGLSELHMFDLYPPIVEDVDMALPFDKAFSLVLEGLEPMGEDYIALLQQARKERWMDVYPTQNKSTGAFSDGSLADVHPFVLLNHNDNLDSAFTIAHELGHSMHSYFSNRAQPFPKRDYSLFVAEVASTCNEAVMLRTLLGKEKDIKMQAYLMNHFLEQFRTTCFRQTMFAEFEKTVHEMAEQHEPLTRDALCRVYLDLNRLYYGETCIVDELIQNEWMRIPHFYNAFYVYVYATGLCAAISLSEKILHGGPDAMVAYRRFLSAGCSVPPIEALKLAGVNMEEKQPLQDAMKVFEETLDQFENALNSLKKA